MPTARITLKQIMNKLIAHDGHFEAIDRHLSAHDKQFELINNKLSSHDKQFELINNRLSSHDKQFDLAARRILNLEHSINERFNKLDERLRNIEGNLESL